MRKQSAPSQNKMDPLKKPNKSKNTKDKELDNTLKDSFPASDPPSTY